MRARSTTHNAASRRTRRIAMSYVVVLLTSIFMINSDSRLQAEDPGEVVFVYFNAVAMGSNQWFVDGYIQSTDIAGVTITLGGAAVSVGTITPDEYGTFYFELSAQNYDYITAVASHGTATSNADLTLIDYFTP